MVIGPYQVDRRLGAGGMGAVYLARHKDLDRLVALKVLRDELEDSSIVERFAREARAVAKLDHPNIVRIYDFGYHDGRPFLAMEYVEGMTLSVHVRDRRPRTLEQVLTWMRQLCDGLEHAHAAGIVHRDIKPGNLIVMPSGQLKILDFGIARLANHSTLTSAGALMGTLNYMAPEQIAGQSFDARIDVFAAGAVAYELLTNRRAFHGEAPETVLHAVLNGTPTPLADLAPALDPRFQSIVDRALAKDPDDRFPSIHDLNEALSRAGTAQRPAPAELVLPAHGDANPAVDESPRTLTTRITTAITQHKKTTVAATVVALLAFTLIPFGDRIFGDPVSTSDVATVPAGGPSPPSPGPPPPSSAPAASMGQVVIDATPWAEIVEIVRDDGEKIPVSAGAVTPSTLSIPVGEYAVVLKGPDGTTQRLSATVTPDKPADVSARFKTVGAAEYLKRTKQP